MGGPQDQRHRPRAATDRANLVTVPALSGRGNPGLDFFTVDLLDGTQAYVLTVIGHAARRTETKARNGIGQQTPGEGRSADLAPCPGLPHRRLTKQTSI
jgi:hypothetical protein